MEGIGAACMILAFGFVFFLLGGGLQAVIRIWKKSDLEIQESKTEEAREKRLQAEAERDSRKLENS
jgi:hypothetical protein